MMKKILISPADERLKTLSDLIRQQDHKTIVMWTIDCANRMVDLFESQFPFDNRPRVAVVVAKNWAFGTIKMPIAKIAAHAAHRAATEVFTQNRAACAASRACGHTVGTVHTPKHAMAFVVYFISALMLTSKSEPIEMEISWLYERLQYWRTNSPKASDSWATFLRKI